MAAQSPASPANTSNEQPPSDSADKPPGRPWRIEGLPKGQAPKPRPRWVTGAIWLVGYLMLFGMLTLQDRLSGPQAIPYTEFKMQVAANNVAELFARGGARWRL